MPTKTEGEGAGKPILVLDEPGHGTGGVAFEFSPDGKKLFTLGKDNTIQVWDAATCRHLKTIRFPWVVDKGKLLGFQPPAYPLLVVAPDGKTLAVQLRQPNEQFDKLFLVDAELGTMAALPGLQVRLSNSVRASHAAFSPTSNTLVAADPTTHFGNSGPKLFVWRRTQDGWKADPMAPELDLGRKGYGSITCRLVDDDSLAVVHEKYNVPPWKISLWNLKDAKKPRDIIEGQERHAFVSFAASPKGRRIVTIEKSGDLQELAKVKIWSLGGQLIHSADRVWWPTHGAPVFLDEQEVRWHFLLLPKEMRTTRLHVEKNKPEEIVTKLPSELAKSNANFIYNFGKLSPDAQRMAWPGDLKSGTSVDPRPTAAGHAGVKVLDIAQARSQLLWAAPPPLLHFAFSKKNYKLAWTGNDPKKLIAGIDLQSGTSLAPDELKAEDFWTPARERIFPHQDDEPRFRADARPDAGGIVDILNSKSERMFTLCAAGQDWVICTEEGYYTASLGGERLVGWHVNNGTDQPASFYPMDRFRKKLFRPDVMALVLKKGSVAEALKAADAALGKETRDVKIDDLLPPKAVLSVVKQDKSTVKLKVQAEASVKDQPITLLRLMLDGRIVPGKETLVEFKDGKAKAEIDWTFELPEGEHQLAVLARSADSSGVSAPIRLKHVESSKLPTLHVLTVGINNYKDAALNLKYAAPDAEALAAAFAKNCKGQPFREVKTNTLLNQQATAKNIAAELAELRKTVSQQDLVIVFFACHGVKHKKEYYLLTHEADIENLDKTCLSGDALRKALAEYKCQVLLMLDACHSVGFGEGKKLSKLGLKPATDDVARDLTEDECGVAVMCAAMGHEKAEGKGGHGLFTQAMLEALEKKPGVPFNTFNQRLYVHHLHGYVFDQVSHRSEERQHPFLSLPWVVESFVIR